MFASTFLLTLWGYLLPFVFTLERLGVKLGSLINIKADIGNLRERPETSSLEFVDKVVGLVRALYKVRLVLVNRQLHFGEDLVLIPQVNQNIFGALR